MEKDNNTLIDKEFIKQSNEYRISRELLRLYEARNYEEPGNALRIQ